MERLKQALTALRSGIEEAIERRKEADARSKDLQAALDAKDKEIALLHDKLSLHRRFLYLAEKWDATQGNVHDNNERILLTNLKAERLREELHRVERERDNFEDRCNALQAKSRELESQLHDLL